MIAMNDDDDYDDVVVEDDIAAALLAELLMLQVHEDLSMEQLIVDEDGYVAVEADAEH
jgi:hypothetical protein